MSEDLDRFENELRTLQPRAASDGLTQRIDAMIDQLPPLATPVTWWRRLGFSHPFAALGWGLCTPALALLMLVAVLHSNGFKKLLSPPRTLASGTGHEVRDPAVSLDKISHVKPEVSAKATNVLYQTFDEGVVLDSEQAPVHRLRYRSADLVEWRNPKSGASWEIAYPREDVVLIPVRAQ